MSSFLKRLSEPRVASAFNRYFKLTFILALLTFGVVLFAHMSGERLRYLALIMPLILVFQYLAFEIQWSLSVRIYLRILAWGWIGLTAIYLLYLEFSR